MKELTAARRAELAKETAEHLLGIMARNLDVTCNTPSDRMICSQYAAEFFYSFIAGANAALVKASDEEIDKMLAHLRVMMIEVREQGVKRYHGG